MQNKIVVAITGASGSLYAKLLIGKLLALKDQWQDLSIVMTENAKTVWETELGDRSFEKLPAAMYTTQDFMAPFASGSGRYNIMIIVPCSMGTLGRIASGVSSERVNAISTGLG